MINRVTIALINTIILLVIIPIIGYVINIIISKLVVFLSRHIGSKATMFIANRLTFVGVIHHELSHTLLLLITGARVKKINLFNPEGNSLGNVVFYTRGNKITKSIQLTMSAIAPVIMGCVTEYILIYRVLAVCESTWQICIVSYLVISILLHMTMSKSDIRNAIRGLPIVTCIIILIMYLTQFNIFAYV